jgi:hypothetical protein
VIGDAHCKADVSNRRFVWLGEFLRDLTLSHPDDEVKVIDMGDWEDMESLSSYDIGKKSYEGRRYQRDIGAALDARQKTNQAIDEYNARARDNHKRRISVQKYALGGNHSEGRIAKVVDATPMLDGTIGLADYQHVKYGWEYVPFLKPLNLDGITYQHYFVSGVMGRPISGESPGLSLIKKTFTSCVSGHSHLLDIAHRTDPHGRAIWGIHAGCFLDKDQYEGYAGPANKLWRRGILVLDDVKAGDFKNYQWISIEELEQRYG